MYEYQEPSLFSGRRGIVFLVVIALHAFMAWALVTGLAATIVQTIIPPVEIAQINKHIKDAPPPPPPKMEDVRPFVPPPEFAAIQEEAPVTAIAAITQTKTPPPPPPAMRRVPPRQDPRHPLQIGEEYYPDQSKRLGEEGLCKVELQVAVDGRVLTSVLKESSGFPRLDQACVDRTKGARLLPGTENGQPVAMTVIVPIRWKLRE
jgi:periplasmic protein TonB